MIWTKLNSTTESYDWRNEMGFWIMLISAALGIALIVLGAVNMTKNRIWIVSMAFGVCSLVLAVWLALPH